MTTSVRVSFTVGGYQGDTTWQDTDPTKVSVVDLWENPSFWTLTAIVILLGVLILLINRNFICYVLNLIWRETSSTVTQAWEWVFPRVFRCWWRLKNRYPYLAPPIPQCYLRLMTRWSRGRVNGPRDVPAVGNNVHHNDEQVEMEEMR